MDYYGFLSLSLAMSGCLVASLYDIKTKKVPNALAGFLLFSSIILALARIFSGGSSFTWAYLSGFLIGFSLGFILWYINAWSGGDAKMFWAISALLPANLFSLNVLINLGIILAASIVILGLKRRKEVLIMPYMTLALMASFYFMPISLLVR